MKSILYLLFCIHHNITKLFVVVLVITATVVLPYYLPTRVYGMESNNYIIQSDSINIGGIDEASSTNYTITDTFGEPGTGEATGVLYRFLAGYRQIISVITGTTCDNDSVCETGETEANCSNDCGCNNNDICESARGETVANCSNDCTTTVLTGGGGGGNIDILAPNIYNLSILPTTYSVVIKWQTSEETISNLFWGTNSNYKKGAIAITDYTTQHSVLIENLVPSSSYHFQIEVKDVSGNKTLSQDQSFKTMDLPDEIPPSNVADLNVEEEDTQINISWQNPPDPDFEGVRIVKNPNFYSQNPNDGEIIFDGKEESFIDKDVFDEDYYYSIFSYDKLKNFSSGAVIKARPLQAPVPPVKPSKPPVKPPVKPDILQKLNLEDLEFWQDGQQLLVKNNQLLGEAGKVMKITLAYNKVPEVLKTIIVSFSNSQNKVFSFLLRVDENKEAYQATIVAPYEAGVYPLAVSILDFQHQVLKEIKGKLLLKQVFVPTEGSHYNIWMMVGRFLVVMTGLGLLFVVGYIVWRISKKIQLSKYQITNTK